MVYLAAQPPGRLCGSREIAEREQIPQPFLWKILQVLRRRRLVRSTRGTGGGYCLALRPDQIRLIQVLEALEDVSEQHRCVLGKGSCHARQPCPLHRRLYPVREHFLNVMERTTLKDVLPGRDNGMPGRSDRWRFHDDSSSS